MGYKQQRKIVNIGVVSKGVILPKGWIDFNALQQGDKVVLLGDRILIISTEEDEARARRLLEIAESKPVKVD